MSLRSPEFNTVAQSRHDAANSFSRQERAERAPRTNRSSWRTRMRLHTLSRVVPRRSLAWLLGLIAFAAAQPAFAQSVSASAGAASPDPVAVGSVATATLDATATPPGVSPGCPLTGPVWSWTLNGGGTGIGIDHPDPNSPAATAYTSTSTPPGVYTLTATATATWTSPCGTYSASGTTGTFTFRVVGVEKLQYLQGSGFVDVSGTLYALVGESITFKAFPDPSGVPFPGGQPVWSGSSGAAGTGDTVTVSFGTLSATAGDTKTVTATCGTSSQTANVVVFDLVPTLTPVDNFAGRDLTTFGVCEYIDLSCPIVPSGVSEYDVGGLEWYIESGGGDLSGGAGGVGTYQCPDVAATVALKVVIMGGVMLGKEKKAAPAPVVPPDSHACTQVPMTGLWHEKNKCGVKAQVYQWAKCANAVSFAQIEVKEGDSDKAKGAGLFAGNNNDVHVPSANWFNLDALVAGSGYKWTAAVDETGFAGPGAPFAAGTYSQNINMWYRRKGGGGAGITYGTGLSEMASDAMGQATVSKAGAGPFVKAAARGNNLTYAFPDPP